MLSYTSSVRFPRSSGSGDSGTDTTIESSKKLAAARSQPQRLSLNRVLSGFSAMVGQCFGDGFEHLLRVARVGGIGRFWDGMFVQAQQRQDWSHASMLAQLSNDGSFVFLGDGVTHEDEIEMGIAVAQFKGGCESLCGCDLIPLFLKQQLSCGQQRSVVRDREDAWHGSYHVANCVLDYTAKVNASPTPSVTLARAAGFHPSPPQRCRSTVANSSFLWMTNRTSYVHGKRFLKPKATMC